ncbi:hypothetical protein TanjilG_04901 [Lupinus angustifolius]|uniref:Uncharacterized protein n=1 Tax=Lupinus angustifolius TaxID=3871 RepID=A0A1J7H177_LUPAN|nr:PREDICTED: uncharacterized protein LOC109329032 [Lupinus angustifolius]OIV95564.1 hypothetical protein TanjilG_04901 [Lupinus angustifolius]
MDPCGRTRRSTSTASKTRTKTTKSTRRKTRQSRETNMKKQQKKNSKSKKQDIPTVFPSSCSSISSQDSSRDNEICEVIDVSSSVCSTPKGQKFRIPEISTCPPAPKKPRVHSSNCSLRRTPVSFFSPPDLEHFFVATLRDVSV